MLLAVEHGLVGPREVAALLGVSRQRVDQLAGRPGFPEPHAVLSSIRIWRRRDIEAWARATGRELRDV